MTYPLHVLLQHSGWKQKVLRTHPTFSILTINTVNRTFAARAASIILSLPNKKQVSYYSLHIYTSYNTNRNSHGLSYNPHYQLD